MSDIDHPVNPQPTMNRSFWLAIVCAVALCGCGSDESRLVGTYNGLSNPIVLKADKTYSFATTKGTWSYEKFHLKLVPTTFDGLNREQAIAHVDFIAEKEPNRKAEMDRFKADMEPWNLKVSDDWNSLFLTQADGGSLTLSRAQ